MGHKRAVHRSSFAVPSVKARIEKARRNPYKVVDEPMNPPLAAPRPTPEDVEITGKRLTLRRNLIERGKISQSDLNFADLTTDKKRFPDLAHTEANCLDEAELRARFPNTGLNHKFFQSGEYSFRFLIPADKPNNCVAQVVFTGKVRLPF